MMRTRSAHSPAGNFPRALALACCWLITIPAGALAEGAASQNELSIEIVNVKSTEGPLRLQILDSEAAFGGSGGSVAAFIVPAAQAGVVAAPLRAAVEAAASRVRNRRRFIAQVISAA